MASIVRPTMLRQLHATAPAKRAFSSTTAATRSFPLSNLRAQQPAFVRDAFQNSTRVAAFHATSRQSLLPALPQTVKGTANDPVAVPSPEAVHGSYHWTFERLVAAGILPLTIAPFASGSLHPVMDATFCGLLVIHSYFGFQACIIDYFPKKRVPKTRSALMWTLRITTILTAVGLYELETNDVGLTEGVRRVWKAGTVKDQV